MIIMIVGHSSMVAKRLAKRLERTNEVIRIGRTDADIKMDLGLKAPEFSKVKTFLENQSVSKVNAIVHCAASFEDDSLEGMLKNEVVNAVGAIHVCELAALTDCDHIIGISSTSAYEHPDNQLFGSYGLSKKHGQDLMQLYCNKHEKSFTSLNFSQIYDEFGEAKRHQKAFYSIMESAKVGDPFCIWGESDSKRNFIFVDDVVDIIVRTIEKHVTGIFPAVSPDTYSFSEIVRMAYEEYGQILNLRFDKSKPSIPSIFIPDDMRLYELLNYYPKTSLSRGISLVRQGLE